MLKYEITNETLELSRYRTTLHRIRALKDFGDVKAGDYGGYIEHELNLSQSNNSWVYDCATVHGSARVSDNAQVKGLVHIYNDAVINSNAYINGINGCIFIKDKVYISDNSRVINNQIDEIIINGRADIYFNGYIQNQTDYLLVGPIGSRNDYVTFYRNSDGGISVTCSWFVGKLEDFHEEVLKKHGNTCVSLSYRNSIDLAITQIILVGKENAGK